MVPMLQDEERGLCRNSAALKSTAESFLPSEVFTGVMSVQEIETGLERGQWLPRKLRITVSVNSKGEESRVQNRRLWFVPRNVFGLCRCLRVSNRSGITKRGSKGVSFSRDNWESLCLRERLRLQAVATSILSFLSNHWPPLNPVSWFRTDSIPLNTRKSRKYSAAIIRDADFERGSPLLILCMSTLFLNYLDNHRPLLISVSFFWVIRSLLNAQVGWQHSAARFSAARFESGLTMQSFIREYLENRALFLYEIFTFIIQFSSMVRMVCNMDGEKLNVPTALNLLGFLHCNLHLMAITEPSIIKIW